MAEIGFFGAGLIGSAMVEGMLKRGHTVRVWNRTRAKAERLGALGAEVAGTVAEAVRGVSRVHLSLADDAAVDAVLAEARSALAPDAVVIDHSTTSPAGTLARADRLRASGVACFHAPVFMSPAAAREAKGLMLGAGPASVEARVRGALAEMSADFWYLGERADLAAAYKLFGNGMIIAITAGLADVLSMARALGISPVDAHGLFKRFNPAAVLDYRGSKMARGDFTPAFELTMARKDVRLMLEAADGVPLAVLPAIAGRMDALIQSGHGAEDMGVLAVDAVKPAG